jgi:ABC-type transporter Mla subunit MlaD
VQQDEVTALIDKTATLMAQYERRGEAIDVRLQALGDTLQGLSRQLPATLKTSTDGVLQALPAEMGALMRDGLAQSLGDYQRRLDAAGHDVEKASQALAGQIGQLQRLHRHLIWKTTGTVALALAVLLAGGAWLSLRYARTIRDNQLSAELLKAYNGADVTLCGGGNLCANVDARGPRYGRNREYLPIKPR